MKKSILLSILVCAFLAGFVGSEKVLATTHYTITDLAPLRAGAINDNGQIAGITAVGWAWHACIYDGIAINDLGTLDGQSGSWSFAYDINNNGQVVGRSDVQDYLSFEHAFLYDGMMMHDLGVLGILNTGESFSRAYGINNIGHVVGNSSNYESYDHAFLYDGLVMHYLGTLGTNSGAYGINDNGQVVGYSGIIGNNAYHAFLYDGTTMHDLDTLGGTYSIARSINNNGQIVGGSTVAGDSAWHAFLYDEMTMYDLGTLSNAFSEALSINDSGLVVGWTWIGETEYHAFLYDSNTMVDLNELLPSCSGWELTTAVDINNSGQIVGLGIYHGEEYHSYLMTPIPETTIQLYFDVKPGNCPNPVNVSSRGVLPVTVLGTEVFDVNEIHVDSIQLFGVHPIQSKYQDNASALSDPNDCRRSAVGPDGFIDLTLKFDKQAVVEALGEVKDGEEWLFELTGALYDGTPIIGQDCVIIKKKGQPSWAH